MSERSARLRCPAPSSSRPSTAGRPRRPWTVRSRWVDFDQGPRRPLRGALVREGGATSFVVHQALSVGSVGDGSQLLVHATTGLWLHDGATLARRERLAPPPIEAMATSPDGSRV